MNDHPIFRSVAVLTLLILTASQSTADPPPNNPPPNNPPPQIPVTPVPAGGGGGPNRVITLDLVPGIVLVPVQNRIEQPKTPQGGFPDSVLNFPKFLIERLKSMSLVPPLRRKNDPAQDGGDSGDATE